MKVLLDTNVVLDVLLWREQFSPFALTIMELGEEGRFDLYLCATTITTIFYLIAKELGREAAIEHVRSLLSFTQITAVDRKVIEEAANLSGPDFEDNVIISSAKRASVDVIVTRDTTGFAEAGIKVHDPASFLEALGK